MAGRGKHNDCPSCRTTLIRNRVPAHADADADTECSDPAGEDPDAENGLFVVAHGLVQRVHRASCSILNLSKEESIRRTASSDTDEAPKGCDCGCGSTTPTPRHRRAVSTGASTPRRHPSKRTSAIRFQWDTVFTSGRAGNSSSVLNSATNNPLRAVSAGPRELSTVHGSSTSITVPSGSNEQTPNGNTTRAEDTNSPHEDV